MRLSARTDYASAGNGVWAGVRQATRGVARYRMPYDQHETVLCGRVRLTDQWGATHELEVGDTYIVRQGTTIVWEARSSIVQTSLLTRPAADAPAPPVVYRAGEKEPRESMTEVDPAALGGTILSEDPVEVAWRLDVNDGGALGGVFEATRLDVMVDFPFTIEHGTLIANTATLTDELGNSHTFGPGDSYLIGQGTDILWEQRDRFSQKTFFNDTSAP